MTERRLPLTKLFPGKVVAKIKIWWPTYSMGIEGPIQPELARLIMAVTTRGRDEKVMAQLDAIVERLQAEDDKKPTNQAPRESNQNPRAAKRTDKAIREELSKSHKAGRIGRRA